MPAVDCDKSITCMLRHDERLPAGGMAFLQSALLYTTPDGHRRVRVHTLALPVASSLGSVFRGADLDTTLQVSSSHSWFAMFN
jgi:protein transport protein SEC24